MLDIVILFCMVLFLIGHMWTDSNEYNYCNVAITGTTLVTFILDYVIAVSSFITVLLNNPTALRWFQKHSQFRLDCLSEGHLLQNKMHNSISRTLPEKATLSVV